MVAICRAVSRAQRGKRNSSSPAYNKMATWTQYHKVNRPQGRLTPPPQEKARHADHRGDPAVPSTLPPQKTYALSAGEQNRDHGAQQFSRRTHLGTKTKAEPKSERGRAGGP